MWFIINVGLPEGVGCHASRLPKERTNLAAPSKLGRERKVRYETTYHRLPLLLLITPIAGPADAALAPTIIDSITLMGLSAADVRLVHRRRRVAVLFLSLHAAIPRRPSLFFPFLISIFLFLLSIHEAAKQPLNGLNSFNTSCL